MQYGVFIFPTEYSMPIDRLAELAEDRGFESLLVPEHPAIPYDRRTPYPAGEPLPREYWHVMDPFVALAYAARATSRIKLGTGICLVSEHEPITLAKTIASLDHLSGGRVLFGIGAGWLREEAELFGTDFERRWAITAERIAAMKTIWREDEPEYHGAHVAFEKIAVFPKPAQRPGPPVLLGAGSHWARRRVAAWADGWMPNFISPARMERGMADIRTNCAAIGRDPATVSFTAFGVPANAEVLRAYRQLGTDRVIHMLPAAPESEVLPALDGWLAAMREAEAEPVQ
jgi:probable F420-dependent oxidoreductase